jgi:hypothetical protein
VSRLDGSFNTQRAFLSPRTFLVGDGAYALATGVMTPYSTAEASFDLSKGFYNFIQRCVGEWVGVVFR